MQYDLVFYFDENGHEYIPIKGFSNDSSLKGIIEFCSLFDNYNDLVSFLYSTGYISDLSQNGVFKIHSRVSAESKPKVFARGITYASEKHFFELSFLEDYYIRNMHNPDFMQPLLDTNFNFILGRLRTGQEHLYYIRHILGLGSQYSFYTEHDSPNLDVSMRNFIRCFSARKNNHGQSVINYSNLMIIARLAINYERQKNGYNPNEPSIDFSAQINKDNETIKNEIAHYKDLLREIDPTSEEYTYYLNKIKQLEAQLNLGLSRRKEDEVTED
ncbi:MAG: hypothetical protein E7161_04600 [Firmicutes bacterium]|nr:hypothetical protein [Bacillota bacterium]